MSDIKITVDLLEIKLHKLIQKMDNMQQTNQNLTQKLKEYETVIQKQNEDIKALKSHFDSIKITNSLLGSDEYKRDTKLKINSLIREIDYCIAQLSD